MDLLTNKELRLLAKQCGVPLENLPTLPSWFYPHGDIAGFQTFPTYRVVFRSDRPSLPISKQDFDQAMAELAAIKETKAVVQSMFD